MRLNIRKKNGYGLNIKKNNLIRIYYEEVFSGDEEEDNNEVPEVKFVEINPIEPQKLKNLIQEFEQEYVQMKGLFASIYRTFILYLT